MKISSLAATLAVGTALAFTAPVTMAQKAKDDVSAAKKPGKPSPPPPPPRPCNPNGKSDKKGNCVSKK